MNKIYAGLFFLALWTFYVWCSLQVPLHSDSASGVLQAADMVSGNILLKGWTLSTGSYYTTDLIWFAIGVKLLGVTPHVLYLIPSFIYAVTVMLILYLSGRSESGFSLKRAAIAFSIVAIPSYFLSTKVFNEPLHISGMLYVLIGIVLLQRKKYVWYAIIITAACFGDPFVTYFGIVPILLAYALRWKEKANQKAIIVTVIAVIASKVILKIMSSVGFTVPGMPGPSFVEYDKIADNIKLTVTGILSLFDANVFGQSISNATTILNIFHFAGLILVIDAVYRIAKHYKTSNTMDLIFTISIISVVLEYLFSNMPIDLNTTRYLTHIILFGSILVARTIKVERINKYALIGACVVYALTFVRPMPFHSVETKERRLTTFLESQNLQNGIAPHWSSHIVTLLSRDNIKVRPVIANGDTIVPFHWLSKSEWYKNNFDFVVFDDSNWGNVNEATVTNTFGKPSEVVKFESYTIMKYGSSISIKE